MTQMSILIPVQIINCFVQGRLGFNKIKPVELTIPIPEFHPFMFGSCSICAGNNNFWRWTSLTLLRITASLIVIRCLCSTVCLTKGLSWFRVWMTYLCWLIHPSLNHINLATVLFGTIFARNGMSTSVWDGLFRDGFT